MIYTVTFNPCLDYIVNVDHLILGSVNRSKEEQLYVGGKGINVSIVLKNLGLESVALGFLAGFTGNEIENRLKSREIATDFIKIEDGMSRINVKIRSEKESEINGQGPQIGRKDLDLLYNKLDLLGKGDVLVLAGSIPASLPNDVYEIILSRLKEKGVLVVVDATKDLLRNVLKYHPFLIKPNHHELGELFDVKLSTKEEILHYAKELQKMGAKNVLISMAAAGAILVTENGEVLASPAPDGKVVNSVGAGDSMVAGFLKGYLMKNNYTDALKMGIATGSASAFSMTLATKEEVERLLLNM